jgi:hypothetical protein
MPWQDVEVTTDAFSRIKQYLKDGRALPIETVINSPTDLRIGRRLALPERAPARRACEHLARMAAGDRQTTASVGRML